jgi:hypothetical protein
MLSSSNDVCVPQDEVVVHPGEQFMTMTLTDLVFDGQGGVPTAPTGPGTYTLNETTPPQPGDKIVSSLNTIRLDGTCQNYVADRTNAVSGSVVTLTSVNDGVYDGEFDVVLDSGDHITGSFAPSACSNVPTIFIGVTPCMP